MSDASLEPSRLEMNNFFQFSFLTLCLDHLQKVLLIFLVIGTAGIFGLAKPGHPPKFSPICLFSEGTFNPTSVQLLSYQLLYKGGV